MIEITVEASVAIETTTGVEGAKDVSFTLTLEDGTEHEGEVTLLPVEGSFSDDFGRWGQIDHWLDGRTIRFLDSHYRLTSATARDILDAIESACSAEC